MTKNKFIRLLPLLIIIAATAWLLVTVAFTETSFMDNHIIGLILLSIAVTTQLFNEKYGYWVTALLLLAGAFSFAAFTPSVYSFHLWILRLDFLCFPVLLLFLVIHRNEIPDWVREMQNM